MLRLEDSKVLLREELQREREKIRRTWRKKDGEREGEWSNKEILGKN